MPGNLDQHRCDLQGLVRLGEEMLIDLSLRDTPIDGAAETVCRGDSRQFRAEIPALVHRGRSGRRPTDPRPRGRVRATLPRRRQAAAARRRHVQHPGLAHWRGGLPAAASFDETVAVSLRLKTQLEILKSAEARFESSLFDIRQLVRADLFDSELDACRELAAHGFLRAAGAIAGVILEKHLLQVIADRGIVVRKTEPTINDFNDHLKKGGVLDVPAWRQIQRLGDIRNLCGHSKHREPKKDEVEEMIDGVDRIVRTLF